MHLKIRESELKVGEGLFQPVHNVIAQTAEPDIVGLRVFDLSWVTLVALRGQRGFDLG